MGGYASSSKCWLFVSEDSGSIDTLHYNMDVSDLSAKTDQTDSNHTFKLVVLNPTGSKVATRSEVIEPGLP